ncbi:MAG: hypothetical protein V7L23_08235, partial [Nostoc sp.]|uniref:hypothetical protein n=1 Tax=Nostoc sp. TaxID=1180 RepID=UPI002FEF9D2D
LRNMLSLLTVFTYFLSIVHLIVSHSSENRYNKPLASPQASKYCVEVPKYRVEVPKYRVEVLALLL